MKNTQERHLGTRSAPICRRGRQSLSMLRDVCVVVVARQGRVDRYTRTATGIGILEYRQRVRAGR